MKAAPFSARQLPYARISFRIAMVMNTPEKYRPALSAFFMLVSEIAQCKNSPGINDRGDRGVGDIEMYFSFS